MRRQQLPRPILSRVVFARQILSFLAGGPRAGSTDKDSATERMLASLPILEAYGNSGMPRNDDSSRFGEPPLPC